MFSKSNAPGAKVTRTDLVLAVGEHVQTGERAGAENLLWVGRAGSDGSKRPAAPGWQVVY